MDFGFKERIHKKSMRKGDKSDRRLWCERVTEKRLIRVETKIRKK